MSKWWAIGSESYRKAVQKASPVAGCGLTPCVDVSDRRHNFSKAVFLVELGFSQPRDLQRNGVFNLFAIVIFVMHSDDEQIGFGSYVILRLSAQLKKPFVNLLSDSSHQVPCDRDSHVAQRFGCH